MREFTQKEIIMAGYVVGYVLLGIAAGFGISGLLFGVMPMLAVMFVMIKDNPIGKKKARK